MLSGSLLSKITSENTCGRSCLYAHIRFSREKEKKKKKTQTKNIKTSKMKMSTMAEDRHVRRLRRVRGVKVVVGKLVFTNTFMPSVFVTNMNATTAKSDKHRGDNDT